jgi:hypothetical protein
MRIVKAKLPEEKLNEVRARLKAAPVEEGEGDGNGEQSDD